MEEIRGQRARGAPVGGILLLFLGVLLLLQNLGILPPGLWQSLIRFWPVIIVIIGLNIVFHSMSPWLTSLILIGILGAVLGVAVWQSETNATPVPASQFYSEALGNIKQGKVTLKLVAGDFAVGSLSSGSPDFAEAASTGNDGAMGFKADLRREGSEGVLSIEANGFTRGLPSLLGARGEIDLTGNVPLVLSVDAVMSNLILDLGDLTVYNLETNAVMGNYVITMPRSSGLASAAVKGVFSNVEINVPQGVGVSITVNSVFGDAEIDQNRFPKQGAGYVSADYETATNKLNLKVDSTFGRVAVR